jgi:hypothetical protein
MNADEELLLSHRDQIYRQRRRGRNDCRF